ncbi:DUF31 family protein [Mycoplasma tullyi]|uniref:DUF31 family protein n=1 Tax=Mycoplasma tullyi TaxID=1612150 RepID=A0A7D7U4G5_9MOLU|nr:DUF31 family protein [Mycoplasma tullyi]QMT98492.1 DUF31 family protein [Mycoplasma tullyi]
MKKRWIKYLTVSLGSALIFSSCTNAKNGSDPSSRTQSSSGSINTGPNGLYNISPDIDSIDKPIPAVDQWYNKVENNQRVVADQYPNFKATTNIVNWYLANRNNGVRPPSFWLKDRADPSHVSPFSLTNEQLKAINDKAQSLGQPKYEDAYTYGFGLPGISKTDKTLNNSIDVINDTNSTINIIYYNRRGNNLAGVDTGRSFLIANDKYKQLSKITYSIRITNELTDSDVKQDNSSHVSHDEGDNTGNWSGTTWILDYDRTSDNSYPTTWYFASNFHVLQHLQLAGDNQALIRNNKVATKKIELFQLNQDMVKVGERIRPQQARGREFQDPYLKVTSVDPTNVKTVFLGNDALKQKPNTFTQDPNYTATQTLLDFGVIRVTFKDAAEAKAVTNDYAEWKEEDKFKPAKFSYLDDEKYKSLPADSLYAFGLPTSRSDGILQREIYGNIENLRTPWINKPRNTNGVATGGGDLSWTVTQRSFVNKPGLTDVFLTVPRLGGGDFYRVNETRFSHTGLGYLLDHYAVPPGGSGSPVINDKNEIVSIIFASDNSTNTGTSLALHSDGFNYQNYYGNYNLPKYDLIYGTGDDNQTKSYRQGLRLINPGQNVNTWLFH